MPLGKCSISVKVLENDTVINVQFLLHIALYCQAEIGYENRETISCFDEP